MFTNLSLQTWNIQNKSLGRSEKIFYNTTFLKIGRNLSVNSALNIIINFFHALFTDSFLPKFPGTDEYNHVSASPRF